MRVCNSQVCPTPSPTTAPTKAPTPVPATTPLIHINNGDIITLEAAAGGVYQDAGAVCEDEIDGKLDVTATGSVVVGKPGLYTISYTCTNHRGYSARPSERKVIVRDNTCPVCHVIGGAASVEAEFPYADKGAFFTDSVDGRISTNIKVISNVNTKKVGTYYIQYRAQDAAGNWNDGKCAGTNTCQREVKVIDTLKPVIGLKFGGEMFHTSDASDLSKSDFPHSNPAASYFSLMAEQVSSVASSSVSTLALLAGGVGLVIVGAAVFTKRSSHVEIEV